MGQLEESHRKEVNKYKKDKGDTNVVVEKQKMEIAELEMKKEEAIEQHKSELTSHLEEVRSQEEAIEQYKSELTSQLDEVRSQLDKEQRVKANMETFHKEQIQGLEKRHRKEVDKYRLKYKKKKEEKAKMDNCLQGDTN